jgi:MtN3 and saliva related transmembrane protein
LSTGEIFGLVAGLFSTFSVVPQIIKIFKYKSAKDISLIFNLMFVGGGFLWLTYGILDHLVPIIIWNVTGITLNCIMLVGKLRYSKGERANAIWKGEETKSGDEIKITKKK